MAEQTGQEPVWDPKERKYEIAVDLVGTSAINPFLRFNHASREAMMTGHLGQALVIKGCEPRRFMTGVELEYGKYTIAPRFPCDSRILRIMTKYKRGVGAGRIKENPITYVFYEDYYDPHRTVNVLEVPNFISIHKDFGYQLHRRQDVWERMREGAMIAKDTALASSVALKEDGTYGLGINANCCFLSLPGTIEDGFIVADTLIERMAVKGYHKTVANAGRNAILLNMYGDDEHYKPFPDIGDRIRPDGLVFALREIEGDESMMEMTPASLRTVDEINDKRVYGRSNAKVVDISVYHDEAINLPMTPVGMAEQLDKYYDGQKAFYQDVLGFYEELRRQRKKDLRLGFELNQLIVEAQIFLPVKEGKKLTRSYRLEKLDEYRVELTYEFDEVPNIGSKCTDFHGGKGVICAICPIADMPVDAAGNRAEIIAFAPSSVKRQNMGRLYEHFFNASGRDLVHRFRKEWGVPIHEPLTLSQHEALIKSNPALVADQFDRVMRYYKLVTPLQHEDMKDADPFQHIAYLLTYREYNYFPPDNPIEGVEVATKILESEEFAPVFGKVRYRDGLGRMVETEANVLIGEMYFMLLEKSPNELSGCSSVKSQFLGIPSKLNNNDKHGSYHRAQVVRTAGEAEVRAMNAYVDPEFTMDLIDQSNNPISHRHVIDQILRSDTPSFIEKAVDRKAVPFGGSRPQMLVRNLMNCMGIQFVEKDGDE